MNLEYAIFRTEPINNLNDLAQIGSHNQRKKKAYKSNPDIDMELSINNIDLVPLNETYVNGFYELTKEYKKEHDERMKTEREDRKKTFREMVNKSKSVVADELLFTATSTFFEGMDKDDIREWADTCMEFVYKDLGYTKEQVLHATVHMDEKTPHIHCVVVPLIKKYDKRTNTERFTISKKQYIRDKLHLSELQDKYHKRLTDKGYDLERGIKNSDSKHIKIKEFKKLTRKLENELNIKNVKLSKAIEEFDNKMKTSKNIPFNKDHIIISKETFESMNKVVEEVQKVETTKKKIEKLFQDIKDYVVSYETLEKQNTKYQREIIALENKNINLQNENNTLKGYIKEIVNKVKKYFKKILTFGSDKDKDITTQEVKEYYDDEKFDYLDVIDIAEDTSKEDELFKYVGYTKSKDKDTDYEMTL